MHYILSVAPYSSLWLNSTSTSHLTESINSWQFYWIFSLCLLFLLSFNSFCSSVRVLHFESVLQLTKFCLSYYSNRILTLFHLKTISIHIHVYIYIGLSDIAARQFSGSLVFVLHEIRIKCIHPSI